MKYFRVREGIIAILLIIAAAFALESIKRQMISDYVGNSWEIVLYNKSEPVIGNYIFDQLHPQMGSINVARGRAVQFPKTSAYNTIRHTISRDFPDAVRNTWTVNQKDLSGLPVRYNERGDRVFNGWFWRIHFIKQVLPFLILIPYPYFLLVRSVAWCTTAPDQKPHPRARRRRSAPQNS